MGERRAGLRRVGFRRAGDAGASSAGGSSTGWASDVAAWMCDTIGSALIDPADAVVLSDDFIAPGGASFGTSWTVTVGAGAAIGHATVGGATWQGGVAVIEQNSGAWTDNNLTWAGPGLTKGVSGDVLGIAFRVYRAVTPAANVFNNATFGVQGATAALKLIAFGTDESLDATHLYLGASGPTSVVTSVLSSTLAADFHEMAILCYPIAGVATAIAYFDGLEVGRINPPSNDKYRPYIGNNKGTYVTDGVCMVVPGAIP